MSSGLLTRRSAGRRCGRYGAVALLLSLAFFASPPGHFAYAQATQPSEPSRIQGWLDDLADKESSVRDRARTNLMGLRPAALGELREAIERTRPLSPAQAAVLHDVVIHVYVGATRATVQADRSIVVDPLRGDAWYFAKSGFLGVLLEPVESASIIDVAPQPPPAPDQQQQQQPDDIQDFGQVRPLGGVLIKETWAGFAGFRFLRVGDVVVATGGDQPTRAPTVQELRAAVQATPAGQTLDLRVLRQGRIVDVPVNVSARPPWATDETITRQVQSRRLRPAELYWQTAFAPLMFKDDGML